MSRVYMNLEAAERLADALGDIAADLDQRADEIDGVLDDAGKDADAPRAARNTARLYDAIGEDIRTRITLLQEADRLRWPPETKQRIVDGYSLWEVREELAERYGAGSKLLQAYDRVTGGAQSARQMLRTIVHASLWAYGTTKAALAEHVLIFLEDPKRIAQWRDRRRAGVVRMLAGAAGLADNRQLAGLSQRFPGMGSALRTGEEWLARQRGLSKAVKGSGKFLAGANLVVSTVDLADDVGRGDMGGVASNVAGVVGGFMLTNPATAPAGAVLVIGSLVYEHREELNRGFDWLKKKLGSL